MKFLDLKIFFWFFKHNVIEVIQCETQFNYFKKKSQFYVIENIFFSL